MVYECERCHAALPAGANACPECSEQFDRLVPPDAEVPRRGWQPKPAPDRPARSAPEAASTAGPRGAAVGASDEPYSDYILPGDEDLEYWRNKCWQARATAHKSFASPLGQRLRQSPLWAVAGLLILVLVLIAVVRPHTNSYVFDQHPLYQANMAVLCNPPPGSLIGRMGPQVMWPYQGHENFLRCEFRSNGSAGIGSDPSAPLTKADLDQEAILVRAAFCAIRYRSGFTPDDAMQCQVYVYFNGSPDTGYDGPDVAPDRDAVVKGQLDQVQ